MKTKEIDKYVILVYYVPVLVNARYRAFKLIMETLLREMGNYFIALQIILTFLSGQVSSVRAETDNAELVLANTAAITEVGLIKDENVTEAYSYNVPFYSQFDDIYLEEWKKLGCGVASVAMVVNYYKPDATSVMALLNQGIASGAYQNGVGWKHYGLAALAGNYGLSNKVYDYYPSTNEAALDTFLELLSDGPVIVSIHNKFDPNTTLGHIIVATGYKDGYVIYNDPTYGQNKKISLEGFLNGWKRRFIVIRGL